jgi:LAO/AO transport system kinase
MSPEVEALATGLVSGDRRALARAITIAENEDDAGWQLVRSVFADTGRGRVVGLTGPPGAGKSTLINSLVRAERAREHSVGVLSIDPSSPFTRGAVLGDRVRLSEHFKDPGVFIRSMASRGALGGMAEAAFQATLLMEAFGHDVVLLESVGVGQSEIDIASHAETVVLVLTPSSGDAVQALKAGVMEIPDVIVVNRADDPGARRLAREVRTVLAIGAGPDDARTPIVLTDALSGTGIEELMTALDEHRTALGVDELAQRRRRNMLSKATAVALARTRRSVEAAGETAAIQTLLDEVMAFEHDPSAVATALLAQARPDGRVADGDPTA